ncbi:ribonuclease T2-like isoform X2 [Apostichopus japonicus]|uniref:ribonuclease T2-like isoform X2 n=1 Tax=Stichopus japonicus TaxID=307972 RepID=UPI003AB1F86D
MSNADESESLFLRLRRVSATRRLMASTTAVAAVLWFYFVLSHVQLFSASFIKADNLKRLPRPIHGTPSNISWDFLILAVQWPQSFCYELLDLKYTNACKVPAEATKWTLHGLWPTKYNGDDVFNCNTTYPFNETEIQDLMTDLQAHWPDVLDPDGTKLWAHEWNKHGTCAGILPELDGEHNYFSKTMQILESFKFDSIFKANHVEPSATKIYKADNFTEAISKSLGFEPVLQCYTTINETEQTTFIEEVEICLNKTFQVIQCPVSPLKKNNQFGLQGNCGKRDIYYPPIISPEMRIN